MTDHDDFRDMYRPPKPMTIDRQDTKQTMTAPDYAALCSRLRAQLDEKYPREEVDLEDVAASCDAITNLREQIELRKAAHNVLDNENATLLAERDALRAENERLVGLLLEQSARNVKPIVDRELANEIPRIKP